uniref:Secreted protein n=1 Tax=Anopheles darlingi TaxID=43151 RepID=A0A2M4DPV6_ANODA
MVCTCLCVVALCTHTANTNSHTVDSHMVIRSMYLLWLNSISLVSYVNVVRAIRVGSVHASPGQYHTL